MKMNNEWIPIKKAPQIPGREIIGIRLGSEPFISFWSPTLKKFYCDPTHYIDCPKFPEPKKAADSKREQCQKRGFHVYDDWKTERGVVWRRCRDCKRSHKISKVVLVLDKDKCQKCKKKNALALHSCPYQSDINNNNKYVCNCCRSCQISCAEDV